jgi:hypothetical protein
MKTATVLLVSVGLLAVIAWVLSGVYRGDYRVSDFGHWGGFVMVLIGTLPLAALCVGVIAIISVDVARWVDRRTKITRDAGKGRPTFGQVDASLAGR